LKRALLWLIRVYQKHISAHTQPHCRFYPTCSNYTYTAIERFGAVRGTLMGMWRILRCNPFNPGGYDPVPEKNKNRKNQQNE
jgi:hypothetical protein